MSTKEDLSAAVVVTIIGLAAYLLIPSQVSMEPVPGSMRAPHVTGTGKVLHLYVPAKKGR